MKLETMEKEKEKLIQHVNDNYSCVYKIKTKKRDGYWEVACWLGQNPTGRLFKLEMTEKQRLNESLASLAIDMYEFLHTPISFYTFPKARKL